MTALVRYVEDVDHERARGWVDLMAPAAELAKAIAPTDFVPRALRHNPAAITAAILYGDEIGIGPMQSLAKIAVIDGRPFIAAEAQRALVLARGHELWIEETTSTRATWCGRRAGSEQVTRITWTMDDARRAHLEGKPNWRNYPRQMLSARASAELVRAAFADVIGGLAALEEIEDDPTAADGVAPADAVSPARPQTRTRRRRGAVVPVDPPPQPTPIARVELPPLPGEEPTALEPEPITQRQINHLHAAFRARGITEKPIRLAYAEEIIGRPLRSSKDLTTAEADRVLEHLEADRPTPEEPPGMAREQEQAREAEDADEQRRLEL